MNPTQLERLERVQLSPRLSTSLGLDAIDLILWDLGLNEDESCDEDES